MSIDAQRDRLGDGDRFAVKLANRSDGKYGQTHWTNVSADQKDRILNILRENDPYYTLTVEDVGASTIRAFGTVVPIAEVMGRIQPGDVGKRVYRSEGGHVSVENESQRYRRWTQKLDQDKRKRGAGVMAVGMTDAELRESLTESDRELFDAGQLGDGGGYELWRADVEGGTEVVFALRREDRSTLDAAARRALAERHGPVVAEAARVLAFGPVNAAAREVVSS